MIRRAQKKDIPSVMNLLEQVMAVHHVLRPDLFPSEGTKYSCGEMEEIFSSEDTPVFVWDEGGKVLGYIFCQIKNHLNINEMPHKTLYIDDLCVDACARGRHIGRELFLFAKDFARREGCYNITLHVWEGNSAAKGFYDSLGMKAQYTSLETIV